MARPRLPGLQFFPVEVTAVDDSKVRALVKTLGIGSLGVLLVVWSRMYADRSGELVLNEGPASDILKGTGNMSWKLLLADTGMEPRELFAVLDTAVNLYLFTKKTWEEKSTLSSPGVKERIANIRRRRELVRKRVESFNASKQVSNAVKTVEIKQKESKVDQDVLTRRPEVEQLFESVWPHYPKQEDKLSARHCFFVNYDNAPKAYPDRIRRAISNYSAYVKKEKMQPRFMIGARKFFEYRWMEWVDKNPLEPVRKESPLAKDAAMLSKQGDR